MARTELGRPQVRVLLDVAIAKPDNLYAATHSGQDEKASFSCDVPFVKLVKIAAGPISSEKSIISKHR